MTIKINILNTLIIIAVSTIFFSIVRGKYHREVNSARTALYDAEKRLFDDSISYRLEIDGLMRNVNEKSVIVVSTQKALRKSEIEKERLKKLKVKDVLVISDLNLTVDSLVGVLNTDMEVVSGGVDLGDLLANANKDKYAELPINASYSDEWTTLGVEISQLGSAFTLAQNIPLTGTIGWKKTGLFKQEITSFVDCPVPYININKNNVLVVEEKKKWHQRGLVLFGCGVVTGLAVAIF